MRDLITHPALGICSTLLWGALEFLALLRARRALRARDRSGKSIAR